MARLELDREDLMREATALVKRIEIQLQDDDANLCVVGVRSGGEVSIYIGFETVFQFNHLGELRRGFWKGHLLKAEQNKIIQLDRQRTESETHLVRYEFTTTEQTEFLRFTEEILDRIQQASFNGKLHVHRQVPVDLDGVAQVESWLNSLPRPIAIANVPNVRT